jgi:antitoxin (DNA-binding transcriptional repressor) of toxin-antitoxin stability system
MIKFMSTYSDIEAKNRLPELIDLALAGEDVVITRQGQAVAQLKAVQAPARPVSSCDPDWLASRRARRLFRGEDAGVLVSRMRDEEAR